MIKEGVNLSCLLWMKFVLIYVQCQIMVSVNVSQKLASLEWLVLHDGIDDPKKTEFLMALDGAKERLHLFQANLLEEGSNDAIVDGCEGVLHTASPVQLSVSNPQVHFK